MKRTIVLADLHLTQATPKSVTDDLARLLAEHAGARVVVNGDLFDLSAESPELPGEQAVQHAVHAHPAARTALAEHVDRGGELWLVGGNHDADLSDASFHEAMLGAIGVSAESRARVRTTPWFFRDGAIHFEHGHLYDPDNAPAHPLVNGEPSLGVHFVEQFIAPTGAFAYLNANDGTPLKLFMSSFAWYGPRAPYVIYRYFHAATAAMLRAGPFYRARREPEVGTSRLDAFAEESGVSRAVLDELVARGPTPTLESLAATFTRLYFDRVIASTMVLGGLGALALGKRRPAAGALALGALVMGTSWARGHDRYQGTVMQRLADGAAEVRRATGAKLVVFGHTHREALDDGYANTASFSFPVGGVARAGRPFLEIEGSPDAPRAVRRYLVPRAA